MDEQTKSRIAQIKSGCIPNEYKITDAGVAPSEWDTVALGSLLEFKNGINASSEKFGSGIKLISVADILAEKYITYDSIRTSIDVSEDILNKNRVNYGDILFQRSSETYEDAGTSNVYLDEKPATFGGFVIRGKSKKEYDPIFLNELLKTSGVRKEVIRMSAGAQHINIGQESLSKVIVNIPMLEEQKRISNVIINYNRILFLKEQAILKKQQQKKWLMQILLTEKKRLAGFAGHWKSIKLGDIFDERSETRCSHLPLLAITNTRGIIPRDNLNLKDNSSEDKSKYLRICPGDIGYNTMRMWQGVSAYSEYEGIVSPAYTILKPVGNIDAKFFSYLFKLPEIISLFYRYSQGLVDDTRNLKYNNFKKITVRVPVEKEEQSAIANILTTADREIELLQQDIELWKQKKKGLMQLLLTGIVRVTD